VHALTYGTSAVKQSLKDVLSRGPERAFWIEDKSAEHADAYVTANVLAGAIKKLGPYTFSFHCYPIHAPFNPSWAIYRRT
jgi:electron transfer flavoprotein beta subunit